MDIKNMIIEVSTAVIIASGMIMDFAFLVGIFCFALGMMDLFLFVKFKIELAIKNYRKRDKTLRRGK